MHFWIIFSVVVKKGNPKSDELEQLADYVDSSDWKKVARKLKIHDPKVTAIHKENEEFLWKDIPWRTYFVGCPNSRWSEEWPHSVIIYLLTIWK